MKKTFFVFCLTAVFFIVSACVTGSPAESVKRYAAMTQTAAAKPTATTRPFVCPPVGYDELIVAEITIDNELAATISYTDRRVTVESRLGSWTSDPLPEGPVRFTMNLQLEDGRQYTMLIDGVICSDGEMFILPPDITPLSGPSAYAQPTYAFGDVCTLSYVQCPTEEK